MFGPKKFYSVAAGVGLAAILMGGTGVAYAQGPQPPADRPAVTADCPMYEQGACGQVRAGAYRLGGQIQGAWDVRGSSLVDATVEATGLTRDAVLAALQDGDTFAQIAEDAGVSSQAIADVFVAERESTLQAAVDAGRLTDEQAAQMLDQMSEHVLDRLSQGWLNQSFASDGRQSRFGLGRAWTR